MKATVRLYDEENEHIEQFELEPVKIIEENVSKKYIFMFEYNKIDYSKYKEYFDTL